MEEIDIGSESRLTSAIAFVEGGVQEACDDSCSICLEVFNDNDPSTVTNCKHEFHLQCILEWCQRSSQCPMCWQSISLKDPTSQELLEAVEQEQKFRLNSSRTDAIFHHPTLGDFELQHLAVGGNDGELQERIIQHLAAAAAMGGRTRQIGRRESQRSRSTGNHGRHQLLIFSTPTSSSPDLTDDGEPAPAITVAAPSLATSAQAVGMLNCPPNQSTPSSQDQAGSSTELQSFSESLKARFTAISMRYKDSISKGTKGFKEKWFSRNTPVADFGSELIREANAGVASVSRMMDGLQIQSSRASDPVREEIGAGNGCNESSSDSHAEASSCPPPPPPGSASN